MHTFDYEKKSNLVINELVLILEHCSPKVTEDTAAEIMDEVNLRSYISISNQILIALMKHLILDYSVSS